MKKAIYIHRSPDGKDLVNIIMEPWGKGITEEEAEEEALNLRLWMGDKLPGHVFDKLFRGDRVKEIPGRIDIPVNDMGNLSEIQKGNFSLAILAPAPLPVKDEARNIVSLKDNPGPMRLVITIEEKPEGEGSKDTLFKAADSLMRYYAEAGAADFRSRFGSLDILEVCKKVIREGEGNPHPWEY